MDLREETLTGLFVGSPSKKSGAVTKAAPGEMIILNLNHQLRCQRLPFGRSLGAPTAWSTGFVSGESRRLNQRLKLCCQFFLLRFVEARGEATVVQESLLIV